MQHDRPKLSIGLPVYNGENYLPEAIDCLLGQTFGDFELILSDNASTDGTEAICRDYAARDKRVRYVRHPVNRGAGWNFSEAFRLSRGEYFKWAAHDDLCAPSFLERCVERLDGDRELALCFTRTAVIDDAGRTVVDEQPRGRRQRDFQGISLASEEERVTRCASPRAHERYAGVLLYSLRGYEVFGVIRSSAMRRTGLHRPYSGAEKVFLVELGLLGRFAEIDEVLFLSRWHDQRFSARASSAAQARHMNPAAARRWVCPRQLRTSWGYLAAIGAAPLSPSQRALCLVGFARYLLQVQKWKRVLSEAVTGRGTTVQLPKAAARAASPLEASYR